jgi:hypothetical protein
MEPFIAAGIVSEGGGNAADLRRGEEGATQLKRGLDRFISSPWHGRWAVAWHGMAAARSAGVGKEKGERGGAGLVGRLAC